MTTPTPSCPDCWADPIEDYRVMLCPLHAVAADMLHVLDAIADLNTFDKRITLFDAVNAARGARDRARAALDKARSTTPTS